MRRVVNTLQGPLELEDVPQPLHVTLGSVSGVADACVAKAAAKVAAILSYRQLSFKLGPPGEIQPPVNGRVAVCLTASGPALEKAAADARGILGSYGKLPGPRFIGHLTLGYRKKKLTAQQLSFLNSMPFTLLVNADASLIDVSKSQEARPYKWSKAGFPAQTLPPAAKPPVKGATPLPLMASSASCYCGYNAEEDRLNNLTLSDVVTGDGGQVTLVGTGFIARCPQCGREMEGE